MSEPVCILKLYTYRYRQGLCFQVSLPENAGWVAEVWFQDTYRKDGFPTREAAVKHCVDEIQKREKTALQV